MKAILSVLVIIILLLLNGCSFINKALSPSSITVSITASEDHQGLIKLTISVRSAEARGVGGLSITNGALRFDSDKVVFTKAEGKNGFELLYCRINHSEGSISLIAINPAESFVEGTIVELAGHKIAEGDLGVTLGKTGVSLVDIYNYDIEHVSIVMRQ